MSSSRPPWAGTSDFTRTRFEGISRGSWRESRRSWRNGAQHSRGNLEGSGRGFPSSLEPQNWTLGRTLDKIELSRLSLAEEAPTITEVRYAASYNWLDGENPVIAVPGSPPFWAPPANQDEPLKPDEGNFYRDVNSARFPTFPAEPAIRATLDTNSNVELGAIDILACSSTFGNLLRFSRSIPSSFRLDAYMIGGTVFLIRKENSPTELLKDVRGYGHTFPAAYTKWDDGLEKSVSHQRIITYEFGGFKCLVRFGCDGYIKNPSLTSDSATGPGEPNLSASGQKLRVVRKGQEVDQAFIFEIKTRFLTRKINMEDHLPKFWITQTPGFLAAYYEKPGVFMDPQICNVKPAVDEWEKEHASALKKFHAVLTRIRDVVSAANSAADSGCVEVSWQGSGPLIVTKPVAEGGELKRALPTDLAEQWRAKLDG